MHSPSHSWKLILATGADTGLGSGTTGAASSSSSLGFLDLLLALIEGFLLPPVTLSVLYLLVGKVVTQLSGLLVTSFLFIALVMTPALCLTDLSPLALASWTGWAALLASTHLSLLTTLPAHCSSSPDIRLLLLGLKQLLLLLVTPH